MPEHEIVEVFRSSLTIYKNLHDRRKHGLTRAEKSTLAKFKLLWNKDLIHYQQLMDKAGITQYELAYLSVYFYYNR